MMRLVRWFLDRTSPLKVIDIGANVGLFSKNFSQHFPSSEIYMFEPNPNCEPYLAQSGYGYEMVALSDESGEGELYLENTNPIATGASLYKENTEWYGEGEYTTVSVIKKRLDECDVHRGFIIDLIKIDTQGSEFNVIMGGKETLNRTKYVLVEVSLIEYNLNAPQLETVLNLLEECGFSVQDIIQTHRFPDIINNGIFQMDILFKNKNI